jgi:hypothetical protein
MGAIEAKSSAVRFEPACRRALARLHLTLERVAQGAATPLCCRMSADPSLGKRFA